MQPFDITIVDGALRCPGCGGENLHHGRIEVFHRNREGGAVIAWTLQNGTARASASGKNPSSRRQGLLIYLDCENCDSKPALGIAQHKGQTLVEWADTPPTLPAAV